jgi:hypothetical protein
MPFFVFASATFASLTGVFGMQRQQRTKITVIGRFEGFEVVAANQALLPNALFGPED